MKRYRPVIVSKDKVEMQQCVSGDWTSLSEYYLLHDRLNEAKAKNDALVQQGIRDHGDWHSKLNFLEADYKAEIARLTAENERLKASQLSLEKWIACEQVHFETADNLREKLYQASVQIERLRQAGDEFYDYFICYHGEDIVQNKKHYSGQMCRDWLAAKEGRDNK